MVRATGSATHCLLHMASRPEDGMTTFLVTVGVGLSTAAILALSAVAFTLEYAVSRVANFAHGEFLTIGAYAAYSGQHFFHQNVAAAALIAAAAGMLAGLALNAGLIEQFKGRSSITIFIATLGAALIVENVLIIAYGAASVSYSFGQGSLHHVGPFLWTTTDLEVIFSALALAGLIYLLLQRTRFGKAVRAVSQDRALAQVSGIPALGLDVVWGWTGDFDLAFYGYLALGSYMTFVLTIGKPVPPVRYIIGWHLPVVAAMVLAVVAVVCLAALIGAVALRNLRDIYLAVPTPGALSATYLLVENDTPLFNGYNGV